MKVSECVQGQKCPCSPGSGYEHNNNALLPLKMAIGRLGTVAGAWSVFFSLFLLSAAAALQQRIRVVRLKRGHLHSYSQRTFAQRWAWLALAGRTDRPADLQCACSRCRRSLGEASGTWLLGFDDGQESLQEALLEALHSLGGRVLHPAGSDHWLVRADTTAIQTLLAAFPSVTAVCHAALTPDACLLGLLLPPPPSSCNARLVDAELWAD